MTTVSHEKRESQRIPSYLRPTPRRVAGMRPAHFTVLFLVLFAAVIEVVARAGIVERTTLIPFSEMVVDAVKLLVSGEFYATAVLPSMAAIGTSFVISSIVGVVLGYVIWRLRPLREAIDPYLTAYYAVPVFALYPMLIAIWGLGPLPITILAILFSVVAVIMNAMNGFDSTPAIIGKLARSLQVGEVRYFFRFFLPYALPYILIGFRLAFIYSLLSVLAAEFLLSDSGLGYFVQNAYVRFDMGDVYGGILVVFAIAVGLERLITAVVRRLTWMGALT